MVFQKQDKWLRFEIKEHKPKTDVYSVVSVFSNCELGEVRWYPSWRHYCFFPTTEFQTVHSDRCLLSVSNFISELNDEHKRKNDKNI